MKNKLIFSLFLLTSIPFIAQKNITWDDLADVKFTEKYYQEYGQYFLYPTFSESVKNLEGKQLTLTGYFLNLDPEGATYILSKGPMASCFFCGVGGPETAVELHFTSKPSFKTDDIITVTGVLELNADDPGHFNYIFRQSEGALFE